jgi:hypothetical protein
VILGGLNIVLIVGALIFTIRGIGKSTPTIKAFPFLNIVKIVALLNIDNSISLETKGQKLTNNIVLP